MSLPASACFVSSASASVASSASAFVHLPLPLLLQLWLTPPLLVCSAFGAASSGGPAPAACSVSVQYVNCWILEARWEMRNENMQIT